MDQRNSNNKRVTQKRVRIFLLFQLIVGVVFFVPARRLDAMANRPFSETVVFYLIDWIITTVWFLGDAFEDTEFGWWLRRPGRPKPRNPNQPSSGSSTEVHQEEGEASDPVGRFVMSRKAVARVGRADAYL
jgi:hypothetical protein